MKRIALLRSIARWVGCGQPTHLDAEGYWIAALSALPPGRMRVNRSEFSG
jgi:hypothetical protein